MADFGFALYENPRACSILEPKGEDVTTKLGAVLGVWTESPAGGRVWYLVMIGRKPPRWMPAGAVTMSTEKG